MRCAVRASLRARDRSRPRGRRDAVGQERLERPGGRGVELGPVELLLEAVNVSAMPPKSKKKGAKGKA